LIYLLERKLGNGFYHNRIYWTNIAVALMMKSKDLLIQILQAGVPSMSWCPGWAMMYVHTNDIAYLNLQGHVQ